MTRIARWITLTLVALLSLLGTVGIAAAAEHGLTTPPANYAELEKSYRLQQQQLSSLDEMINRDGRRGDEVTGMIASAKASGKNTSSLEASMVIYRDKLVAARASWQIAARVLKAHVGFSDGGKVTNADQARATLKAAGSALEKSYLTARSAEELLNKVVAALHGRK